MMIGKFYIFLKRLEVETNMKTLDALIKTDSKDLITLFSSSPNLHEEIELVMQATYVRAIKTSVESIAESMISVFNNHNSDIRPVGDAILNDEMFVTWNGPEMGECDTILRKALEVHFSNTRL